MGLPKTLSLAALSFVLAVMIAVPAGIVSALRRNCRWTTRRALIAFLGVSMPGFWLGIILILIFAVRLQWLPAVGYSPIGEDGFGEWFKHLLLAELGDRGELCGDLDAVRAGRTVGGAQ